MNRCDQRLIRRNLCNQLRGLDSVGDQSWPFPIDLAGRRSHSAVAQSREWVDGSWVTGQMGHENRMGHMGHGSHGSPMIHQFLTLWLGLYIVALYRVSL